MRASFGGHVGVCKLSHIHKLTRKKTSSISWCNPECKALVAMALYMKAFEAPLVEIKEINRIQNAPTSIDKTALIIWVFTLFCKTLLPLETEPKPRPDFFGQHKPIEQVMQASQAVLSAKYR